MGTFILKNSVDIDKLMRNSKQIFEVYPNTTIKSARARNIGQKVLKGIKNHGNFQITIIMTKNRLLRLKGKKHQKTFLRFFKYVKVLKERNSLAFEVDHPE